MFYEVCGFNPRTVDPCECSDINNILKIFLLCPHTHFYALSMCMSVHSVQVPSNGQKTSVSFPGGERWSAESGGFFVSLLPGRQTRVVMERDCDLQT